jgi:hypothetical protein
MKYELDPYNRNVPDDELLADLKRVATELGKGCISSEEYDTRGRFSRMTLIRRFGSWFAATDKVGLRRIRNLNNPQEELFSNLVELWTSLGRQPHYSDLKKAGASKFGARTYVNRFGTWRRALEAFCRWANEGEVAPSSNRGATPSGKRTPRDVNWRLRALVLMRDGARCRLCGAVPSDGIRLHVDHVKPWTKGGETVLENLQVLCNVCNIGKSDVEPRN